MKRYTVQVNDVDYEVTEQDVMDYIPEFHQDDQDFIDDMVFNVKYGINQKFVLEIECEPDELDELVCDEITHKSGWLVNTFNYEILKEEDIDETI